MEYASFIVDELGQPVLPCGSWSQSEIDSYLAEHPEYYETLLPIN